MHIVVVGLNYRTAPVEIRERFAVDGDRLPEALDRLKAARSILECVIVATCNRTEVYAVVDRLHVCGHDIRMFMESWFGVPVADFSGFLYIHEDQKAIRHLMRVTSGLDSMVIGETQILGQIRDAFLLAQNRKTTGTLFNKLFKQSITLAKRAFSETNIGDNAVSVSYAAVELGKRIFGDFRGKRVLIAGAGETGELTAKHLLANGAAGIAVANRTVERAQELALTYGGSACSLDELPTRLCDVDILISSTGANGHIISKTQVEDVMARRKGRPLFLIDIAVPRDLDPAIANVDNVFLYDIDDLEGIVESNLELRRKEAEKIEAMIRDEMAAFDEWYRTLGVTPVIRALQEKAASIHEETMESLFNKLPDLGERERKVIRKLTKSIVNQMLHDPILRVKDMTADKKGSEALDLFVHLFALEERMADLQNAEARNATPSRKTAESAVAAAAVAAKRLFARS